MRITADPTEGAVTSARPAGPGVRPRDWVLGLVVMAAHLFPVRTGQGDDPSGAWAGLLVVALAAGSGLSLVSRRRHSRLVAGCVLACYAGLSVVQGMVPPYAAWVLIWSLATTGGDRRESVTVAGATAAATSVLLVAAELSRPGVGAVVVLVALTVLVTLVAVLVRSERARVEAVGRRAATEERLRIARDLHDLVGHGLSTIAVQSSTARLALAADDPATAARALSAVESSSRTALREMRQMLGVLSDESPSDSEGRTSTEGRASTEGRVSQHPAPGLAALPALIDNLRAAGVATTFEQTGSWEGASPAAQLVAYRVVQESLTNAIKHAPGAMVSVRLRHPETEGSTGVGTVTVETTGTTPPSPGAGRVAVAGRGLDGLRTRVSAVGGEFTCGPTGHGWLVEARIPLHQEPQA